MRLLRNIGIIAHIDAGKTTVSERFLFYTGRIHATGETHDGASVLDFEKIEQEKGITINAAATYCEWRHTQSGVLCRVNLIDTPGHVDFTAEVERSLRVLDGAICVVDAKEGVEAQTETVWRQADRYRVPRLTFINKMDKRGADFDRCLAQIATRLRISPLAVQVPIGSGDTFAGVIDLLAMQAVYWQGPDGLGIERVPIPASLLQNAESYRQRMLDTLGGFDDVIGALVLENRWDEIDPVEVRAAIRRATLARRLVPVLCGTALRNAGVQTLLDAVVDYLPSPEEVAMQSVVDVETDEALELTPDMPSVGLVFKTVRDEFGTLSYVRLFSGVLSVGDVLSNARTGTRIRIGRLFRMHADKREPVKRADAGDFVATVGLGETRTGDTLCNSLRVVAMEAIRFPEPVITMSIEAETNAEADKLAEALAVRAQDDPTLRISTDPDTGQVLVAGMGELQLTVLQERLRTLHGLNVLLGAPRVAFREAPRVKAETETEGLHSKQTGGAGSYGHVKIRWSSLPADQYDQVEFVDETRGGVIPRAFVRSAEAGLREAALSGGPAGFPVGGLRAVLYDGSNHDVDGKDFAFASAARIAFRKLLDEVGTEVLEPVMRVEGRVPDEFTGAVVGDLNKRRGRIQSVEGVEGGSVIRAIVPLAEMFGYVGQLRSLTQGRGAYSMEPAGYEQAPEHVKQQLLAARK